MLLIIGNDAVLDGRLNTDRKVKQLGEYKKALRQNKPYLIAYLEELCQRDAWVIRDVEPVTKTPEILQLVKIEAGLEDDEVKDGEGNNNKVRGRRGQDGYC